MIFSVNNIVTTQPLFLIELPRDLSRVGHEYKPHSGFIPNIYLYFM
jgi:hypothetical protein